MRAADRYQIALILLGLAAAVMFWIFLRREIYPEYKIYQNDYIALEEFRSTYSGEPPPAFQVAVKQIVMNREDKGPPTIDRCISCHVALQISDFSPTKIATDINGKTILDEQGIPKKIPNDQYIWSKLDQKIADLRDEKVIEQLRANGEEKQAEERLKQAAKYESLKTATVDEHVYDVKKALSMHPLIGKETFPFEFHSADEFGCVSCHNGNGRGLTTEKAHGPIFDGEYDVAFTGHKPHFTESDPENDPPFARMFNFQPGDALQFQTTPLLIGGLIEAKCIQCHQPNSPSTEQLTQNYTEGEQLFISQACYACHRIAGSYRGGVGPELTLAVNLYPWYLKESIVWPQADLPTSTMPNYQLDHIQLEKLMTFLMGQTGKNKAVSEIAYKTAIQQWEAGQKSPWEKPITPVQMLDLNYSMTVFATEGCAACHRLKGFQSDVGFAIEKDSKPTPEKLYEEQQWFSQLFPEEIIGSDIVAAIDKNREEIDRRIVNDVRKDSILEKIEKSHPGDLEAFYTNFEFASRAKNHYYSTLIAQENDPAKKQALENELSQWKLRINRLMMVYIQEYGLGRLIGPRPNWSGVYRSDEWLMEHFHNPSGHTPRSIMPIFPFDDTKFYALTHMLDVLGIRNRDSVREIWTLKGFDPAIAAHIYCSQCHGEFLLGNGPVSTWIYPIPKNLRNPDFLRNMTKENVIHSITHGILGTPMPPWGEVAVDKSTTDGIPVLTQAEIKALADWLFSSVPGGEVIKTSQSVPKWQYGVQDVIRDLQQEGSPLAESNKEPTTLFQAIPNPNSVDKQDYYIKQKFYTEENINKGKAFFQLNCAVCHGAEAEGSGPRAEIMQEAKPRMLTNLDWISTHDDLYLLRSIKFGVPGTAMTPWGDLTSSTQRLQLVMFIRSLAEDQTKRELLLSKIYKAFEVSLQIIETARLQAYSKLQDLQAQYDEMLTKRSEIQKSLEKGVGSIEEATTLYEKSLEILQTLTKQKALDSKYVALKDEVKKEEELYKQLGLDMLNYKVPDKMMHLYLEFLSLYERRYQIKDDKLMMDRSETTAKNIDSLRKELLQLGGTANPKLAKTLMTTLAAAVLSDEKQQAILNSL